MNIIKSTIFESFYYAMGVNKHSKTIVLIEHRNIKNILKVITFN